MGLLSLLMDGVVLSSGCAAVRRVFGLNVHQIVAAKIPNETGKKFTNGFFSVGEWVVDKSVNLYQTKIANKVEEDVPEAKYKEVESSKGDNQKEKKKH